MTALVSDRTDILFVVEYRSLAASHSHSQLFTRNIVSIFMSLPIIKLSSVSPGANPMKLLLAEITCILQEITTSKTCLLHFTRILRVIPARNSTKKCLKGFSFGKFTLNFTRKVSWDCLQVIG